MSHVGERDQSRIVQANTAVGNVCKVIQQGTAKGAECMMENPRRSLFWMLPDVIATTPGPLWQDVDYDSCCWGGARKKAQTLRTTMAEAHFIQATCAHIHPTR